MKSSRGFSPNGMKVTTDNDDEDNDETNTRENNIIVRVLFCGEEFNGLDSKLRNAT